MRIFHFSATLNRAILLGFLAFPVLCGAQNSFTNVAGEYAIVGPLPGEQTGSDVVFNSENGWIVWQDNATDGAGFGISARHLDSSLSGDFSSFRVNQNAFGDQENPKAALLKNGGAAFVWQGGRQGFQEVYARFLSADGTFGSGDIQINSHTNSQQIQPVIASLNNSNVVVSWSSYGQDGNLFGVYSRILSPSGQTVGNEFQVNQTTVGNQRSPSVAALAGGNFVVVWSCEKPNPVVGSRMQYVVNIFGRRFNSSGASQGNEFLISSATNFCSNPTVASTADGGFAVAWNQKDNQVTSNGWEIFYRSFDSAALALNPVPVQLNTQLYGDQFSPKIASHGTNALIIWTSLGQDGSFEGVYGKYIGLSGQAAGGEFRVNTTTLGNQVQPALGVDGDGRYLTTWSSHDAAGSMDLYAQRYSSVGNTLPQATTPYISALSSSALSITWSDLAGYSVAFYELYVDGSTNPLVVNGNYATVTNLAPSSSHSFQLLYQLTDGQRSSLSLVATGATYGADGNGDGLPDDWQGAQWGNNPANWPSASTDSDGDGASNSSEFLAGTDPKNAASVLRTRLARTPQGFLFSWNTQAGLVYQVQSATSLSSWQNLGSPRFARGSVDSINLGKNNSNTFYRVIRLR